MNNVFRCNSIFSKIIENDRIFKLSEITIRILFLTFPIDWIIHVNDSIYIESEIILYFR